MNGKDSYTAKYSASSGTRIWYHVYDEAINDIGTDLAVSDEVVYVTGKSGTDYFTLKFDPLSQGPEANLEWVKIYNNNQPGNDDDGAVALFLDPEGIIHVTGTSKGEGTNYDFYTVQYSTSDSMPLWEARYDYEFLIERALDLSVHGGLYIYVVGKDFRVVKYDK